jgi:hypothetical protein
MTSNRYGKYLAITIITVLPHICSNMAIGNVQLSPLLPTTPVDVPLRQEDEQGCEEEEQ